MADPCPTPVAAAILAHSQAYDAGKTALDRLFELRQSFDPELDLDLADEIAIGRAITARYGYRFGEVRRDLRAREAAANSTAEAEDATWLSFRAMVPVTAAELREWVAYVIEHSARMDEVVNLRHALEHVGVMLAERLPTAPVCQ